MGKTTLSASIPVDTGMTAGVLQAWLAKRPQEARISISHTAGDRPFEGGSDTITARWEEDS